MRKFKIGDKVRVLRDRVPKRWQNEMLLRFGRATAGTVIRQHARSASCGVAGGASYSVKSASGRTWLFHTRELEPYAPAKRSKP